MERLTHTARDVMGRHPAPALPAEKLQSLLAREQPGSCPSVRALLQALKEQSVAIRVLEGDTDRFGAAGPTHWVLTEVESRNPGPSSPRVLARMRESVRVLGWQVEPGSNLALARWARLLDEERRARRAINRVMRPRTQRPL